MHVFCAIIYFGAHISSDTFQTINSEFKCHFELCRLRVDDKSSPVRRTEKLERNPGELKGSRYGWLNGVGTVFFPRYLGGGMEITYHGLVFIPKL